MALTHIQAFEKMSAGLEKQGHQCRHQGEDTCAYRNDESHCAMGWVFDKEIEENSPIWGEDMDLERLLNKYSEAREVVRGLSKIWLTRCQEGHDFGSDLSIWNEIKGQLKQEAVRLDELVLEGCVLE